MSPLDELNQLLNTCLERGASDLHVSADWHVLLRVHGDLVEESERRYSSAEVEAMLRAISSDKQQTLFEQDGQLDMGYSDSAGERYRINAYREMGRCTLAIRHLDQKFQTIGELRLPAALKPVVALRKGLVLVTGGTGSGKSTTLATLIHEINKQRRCHIITIEDPVEFVHGNLEALVHQREVNADTRSFADAVRASLREDPDVVLVGEMRDLETMKAALTAAETGHLVFSTLHTNDAVGVIERMVGSFPGDEQDVARNRIAMALQAVIAQTLIPTSNGRGRVPAVEILRVNNAVSNMIDSGKTKQIYSMMESGREEGMQTFDQALVDLVRQHWISQETAQRLCRNQTGFDMLLQATSQPAVPQPNGRQFGRSRVR
jgi:twitching motility protein PilT